MSPNLTKRQAIQIALDRGAFSLAQLSRAGARLSESLEKGTPGGQGEHRYVQDRTRDLDQAIAAREASENEGESHS